jgi:hypothetical protein
LDRITGKTIPAVATTQIYKGSIAFIVLQLIMVAVIITTPTLVTGGIEKVELIDADKALEQLHTKREGAASAADSEKEDPMKGLLESMKQDQNKK